MRTWLKNRTTATGEEYVRARNNTEKVKRKAKNYTLKKTTEMLQDNLNGGKRRIYALAKTYKKNKEKVCNIN